MQPIRYTASTVWRHLLTFGKPQDFTIFTNFTRSCFESYLLPAFQSAIFEVNYGSLHSKKPKTQGREPQLDSIDVVDFALYNLTSRETVFKL